MLEVSKDLAELLPTLQHQTSASKVVRKRSPFAAQGRYKQTILEPLVCAARDLANINLHMSQNRDKMVKILFNKAAKPWYSLSETANPHLPAVVQPDPATLGTIGHVLSGPERETTRRIEAEVGEMEGSLTNL